MDRHELAWAAGFFDGEGWAGAVRNRARRQPVAQINQGSDDGIPEALPRFQRAVDGVGHIRGPQRKLGRRDLYRWTASSRGDVERAWHRLRPWLGLAKSLEFLTALDLPMDVPLAGSPTAASEEFAWAAGFFDGEGSVYLAKHRSHVGYFRVEAAVTQSSGRGVPPVLERFRQAVGAIGFIYGPFHPRRRGHRPVYRWKLYRAAQISTMCQMLGPWLGSVKRKQADEAFAVLRSQRLLPRGNPAWGWHKTHCVKGHEYATARIRPYRSRGAGVQRRDSKQCLACLRDYARRQRELRRTRGVLADADDPEERDEPYLLK